MALAVFIQDGASIDYTPSGNVAAGDVIVQGDLVGVAKTPIAAEQLGALAVEGVFDFPKRADDGVTFAVGDLAWWDAGGRLAWENDGHVGWPLLGKVVKAAADGDATVRVRLCPCATSTESGSSSGS